MAARKTDAKDCPWDSLYQQFQAEEHSFRRLRDSLPDAMAGERDAFVELRAQLLGRGQPVHAIDDFLNWWLRAKAVPSDLDTQDASRLRDWLNTLRADVSALRSWYRGHRGRAPIPTTPREPDLRATAERAHEILGELSAHPGPPRPPRGPIYWARFESFVQGLDRWLVEQVPTGARSRTKDEVNGEMCQALARDPEKSLDMTLRDWASEMGCSVSTVQGTEMWRWIRDERKRRASNLPPAAERDLPRRRSD